MEDKTSFEGIKLKSVNTAAKPSSTKATTAGDPPPIAYVEVNKPPTVNGRPQTSLPHMPDNYRY